MENKELHEVAKALEPLLDGWDLDWDPQDRPRYALFINEDGAGINVELYKGRLIVIGRYPPDHYPYRQEDRPRITVAANRPVEKIVASIKSRFLPKYLPIYANAVESQRQDKEHERRKAAALAELANIVDVKVSSGMSGKQSIRFAIGDRSLRTYGTIEVGYKNMVKIDLDNLPLETAREICRMLKDL